MGFSSDLNPRPGLLNTSQTLLTNCEPSLLVCFCVPCILAATILIVWLLFECGDYLRVASNQRNVVVTQVVSIHNGSIFTFSAKAKKQF